MHDIVAVGAGEVFEKYWFPTIQKSKKVRLAGVVEISANRRQVISQMCPAAWIEPHLPDKRGSWDPIVLILTPDHFPSIQEAAEKGYRNVAVEKPLVSRDSEVAGLLSLDLRYGLRLYATDLYIPKAFPLRAACGVLSSDDPRAKMLSIAAARVVPNTLDSIKTLLGDIEGVTVSVVEGGDLGLPSLNRRQWLEHDNEIGGMLRALGTHVFAPLVSAGLLDSEAEVLSATLAKLTANRRGIEPVNDRNDVEMYVSALLAQSNIPVHVSLGKLPQKGGEWSIVVRGSKGMFFTSLRSGGPPAIISTANETVEVRMSVTPMEFVIEEMLLFYEGLLPGFDGNLGAILASLVMNRKVRETYFSSR